MYICTNILLSTAQMARAMFVVFSPPKGPVLAFNFLLCWNLFRYWCIRMLAFIFMLFILISFLANVDCILNEMAILALLDGRWYPAWVWRQIAFYFPHYNFLKALCQAYMYIHMYIWLYSFKHIYIYMCIYTYVCMSCGIYFFQLRFWHCLWFNTHTYVLL